MALYFQPSKAMKTKPREKKRPGRKKKPEHLKESGQTRYIPLALLETVDKMIEEYYEQRSGGEG